MSDTPDVDLQIADAITFAASRAHIDQHLRRLTEVLEELFVAGLAYPNPDLFEELPALAERAQQLGLATPAARLLTLNGALLRVTEADEARRPEEIMIAWEEIQRLSAWLRLFRREQALLLVGGRLAAEGEGQVAARPKIPTADLSAWPVGAYLKGESLSLFALEVTSGQPILLHDQLSELRADAPLARPVISRLFQAQVSLRALLSSVIRLEAHPIAMRQEIVHVNPAFRCVPRLIEVTSTFKPPSPQELQPEEINKVAGRVEAWLDADGRTFRGVEDAPLPIAMGATLRFNMTKWRAQHLDPWASQRLTLLPQEEAALVIAAEDEWGDLSLPQLDPHAVRWTPSALYGLAEETEACAPADHRFARTIMGVFGALDAEAVDALRGEWLSERPEGILAWGRAADAWALLSLEPDEENEEAMLALADLALEIAALPKAQKAVDEQRLAAVLGLDPKKVSSVSRRKVNGEIIFTALRLIAQWGDLETRVETLKALFEVRYKKPGAEPSVGDICARAVLLDLLEVGVGQEVEEDERAEQATAQALAYLDVFLRDLRPRAGRPQPAPLPTARDLLHYSQARALLTGGDLLQGSAAALELPEMKLAQIGAEGLLRLARSPGSSEVVREGGEALLLVISAQLSRYFVVL